MNEQLDKVLQKQKKQINEPEKVIDDVVQLVGFIIGNEEYAIPILSIQEIIKPIEFTRVPQVPDYVMGVFNLRGDVIPLINLRKKFNLQSENQTDDTRYMVLKGENNIAGFMIDRLTKAIRIKKDRIDPPPETIHSDSGMIYGIGKQANSMITILRVEALLKRDF